MKKRKSNKKSALIIFTRGLIYLMGIAVLSVCGILLPELAREEAVGKVNPPSSIPFLIGAWILSVPVFIGLHQALKILSFIDNNRAFSELSVKSLSNIKICSVIFSLLIVLSAVMVIITAKIADPTEDVTHVVTIGFVFAFASSIVATFAAVMQRLLKEAVNMKSENDLIV